MLPTGHGDGGNAIARVAVMVCAAVVLQGMAGLVVREIEAEGLRLTGVHAVDDIAELRRETAEAYDLQVSRAGPRQVVDRAPADHVHVDLRHQRVAGHRGVIREPSG